MTASTSIAAFHTAAILPMRERVFEIIDSYGVDGCIADDVIEQFHKSETMNTSAITARFSELVRDERVIRCGDTRMGASGKQQLVMRSAAHATSFPAPKVRKVRKKTGFLAGMLYATKILIAASDLTEAKRVMKKELIKASKRS